MSIPIGTILAFAGPIDNWPSKDWLYCNGDSTISSQEYPDLYGVIGTTFGGTGAPNFSLPDLRGMFLRGLDNKQGRDPDAAARFKQGDPGYTLGDMVGSWQLDAMQSHNHQLSGAVKMDAGGWTKCDVMTGNWDSGFAQYTDPMGGNETRPRNVAVHYLICATPTGAKAVNLPAATVFAFSGIVSGLSTEWLYCQGTTLTISSYPLAFTGALGTLYGSNIPAGSFILPDLRGMFIRGQDNGTKRDPDAATRTYQPQANVQTATAGDQAGSWQTAAFLRHAHYMEGTYGVDTGTDWAGLDQTPSGNPDFYPTDNAGGNETRPKNVAVNYLIESGLNAGTSADAGVPVGTVVTFAGPAAVMPGGTGWLFCDGSSIPRTTNGGQLFAVIGTTYGSVDGDHFNLPDHRGIFLRGRNDGSGRDPDAGQRYAQGQPGAIVGDVVGSWQDAEYVSHSHGLTGTEHVGHVGGSSTQVKSNDSGTGDTLGPTFPTGDDETRPLNVAMNHFIWAGVPS